MATVAAETEADGSAIRELGSLFTVSQVYLRDDAEATELELSDRVVDLGEHEQEEEPVVPDCCSKEDLELADHMAALGLPLSFGTSKQVGTSGRKKSKSVKSRFAYKDKEAGISVEHNTFDDCTHLAVSIGNAEGLACEASLSVDKVAEIETSDKILNLEHAGEVIHSSTGEIAAEKLGQSESSDAGNFSEDMSSGCYAESPNKQDSDNTSVYWELGDWRVIWDNYYRRNYFYNYKTEETTWYAPPGLEYLACSCSISTSNSLSADAVEQCSGFQFNYGADEANKMQALSDPLQENINVINQTSSEASAEINYVDCLSKKSGSDILDLITVDEVPDNLISHHPAMTNTIDGMDIVLDKQEDTITYNEALNMPDALFGVAITDCLITSSDEVGCHGGRIESVMMDELDNNHEIFVAKRKQRRRRYQSQLKWQGVLDLSADIFKYWCQRYSLFSRYDSGIKMDEEGWFSVTPEAIAIHHATRNSGGVVIDCFTGVGGNAIQFAMKSNHVIAIDIDPQKIELAHHNSTIYGVNDKIDFIQGDFFKMATHLKGDTVFLSPPWGGPDYGKVQTYDIRSMLKPYDGYFLFKTASKIASKVVIFLPRNVDFNQLAELSLSVYPPWAVEVEKNILNGKFKAVTAYFSRTT